MEIREPPNKSFAMESSTNSHSAATTLDDIITELKLSYDSSLGLLDGDSIRDVPNSSVLQNLSKLLNTLSKELKDVDAVDSEVLKAINSRLNLPEEEEESRGDENAAKDDVSFNGNGDSKHSLNDSDADEETIPLAKRRKPSSSSSQIKVEDEDEEAAADEITTENTHALESAVKPGTVNTKDDYVPPVQVGSFTQDNDTRLKNPRSEFVASQSLPVAITELGLYSEEENGLKSHGKEYLKKKYAVASYPERDLLDMLPGLIPNTDFSKNKPPSNQVQFTTFQSYIESFFRLFLNDDIQFLNEKNILPVDFNNTDYDPNVSPYLIPKLGPFYADIWSDEDASLGAKLNSPAYQQPPTDVYKPRGSIDNLSDEKLYTEDISCGPLSNRLLSAILSINDTRDEDEGSGNEGRPHELDFRRDSSGLDETEEGTSNNLGFDIATQLDSGEDYNITTEVNDFYSIEERLKRELKYIGIFMNLPNRETDDDKSFKIHGKELKKSTSDRTINASIIDDDEWIKNKEDDEVCAEIRMLQNDLKEAVYSNRLRKKRLVPVVEEQVAYQEYCTILEDLDKQVDQAYIKRLKAKSKKKKLATDTPQLHAVNSGLRVLLDKRNRWIDNIGKLFDAPEIMKRVPKESVFKGEEPSDDEEIDGEDIHVEDGIINK